MSYGLKSGWMIYIPISGRSSDDYRRDRQNMMHAGLTPSRNEFASREEALAAMQRYSHALPVDAHISRFAGFEF